MHRKREGNSNETVNKIISILLFADILINGRWKRTFAVLVTTVMIVVTFNVIMDNNVRAEYGMPDEEGKTDDRWVIEKGDVVSRANEELILYDDLIIKGILYLDNVILQFSQEISPDELVLHLEKSGELYISGCELRAYNEPPELYKVILEGKCIISDSTIENLYWDNTKKEGGVFNQPVPAPPFKNGGMLG